MSFLSPYPMSTATLGKIPNRFSLFANQEPYGRRSVPLPINETLYSTYALQPQARLPGRVVMSLVYFSVAPSILASMWISSIFHAYQCCTTNLRSRKLCASLVAINSNASCLVISISAIYMPYYPSTMSTNIFCFFRHCTHEVCSNFRVFTPASSFQDSRCSLILAVTLSKSPAFSVRRYKGTLRQVYRMRVTVMLAVGGVDLFLAPDTQLELIAHVLEGVIGTATAFPVLLDERVPRSVLFLRTWLFW